MQQQWKLYLLVFSLLLGLAVSTPAVGQTYTTIDYPGSPGSFTTDISVKWGQRK